MLDTGGRPRRSRTPLRRSRSSRQSPRSPTRSAPIPAEALDQVAAKLPPADAAKVERSRQVHPGADHLRRPHRVRHGHLRPQRRRPAGAVPGQPDKDAAGLHQPVVAARPCARRDPCMRLERRDRRPVGDTWNNPVSWWSNHADEVGLASGPCCCCCAVRLAVGHGDPDRDRALRRRDRKRAGLPAGQRHDGVVRRAAGDPDDLDRCRTRLLAADRDPLPPVRQRGTRPARRGRLRRTDRGPGVDLRRPHGLHRPARPARRADPAGADARAMPQRSASPS